MRYDLDEKIFLGYPLHVNPYSIMLVRNNREAFHSNIIPAGDPAISIYVNQCTDDIALVFSPWWMYNPEHDRAGMIPVLGESPNYRACNLLQRSIRPGYILKKNVTRNIGKGGSNLPKDNFTINRLAVVFHHATGPLPFLTQRFVGIGQSITSGSLFLVICNILINLKNRRGLRMGGVPAVPSVSDHPR
jgi:hypothetical protein